MEINIVDCDSCKKSFSIRIQRQRIYDDITQTYFECPNCKERYHVLYTDKHSRKIQKELQKSLDKLKKNYSNKNVKHYEDIKLRFEKATEEVNQKVREL